MLVLAPFPVMARPLEAFILSMHTLARLRHAVCSSAIWSVTCSFLSFFVSSLTPFHLRNSSTNLVYPATLSVPVASTRAPCWIDTTWVSPVSPSDAKKWRHSAPLEHPAATERSSAVLIAVADCI